MIEGGLILWFFLTFLSLIFLIWDQIKNTPAPSVMKWAWFLTVLYTGPIGLFFYLLSCRQPFPDTHDAFISAHWKQALGSEIHCVAGDATAIILSAGILHYFEVPNGWEAVIEYIAAYLFGLFIFQALFMRQMFASYLEAVKRTIFSETVSMNFVMSGMLPAVLILKYVMPKGSNPSTLLFWGIMSFATIMGFLFAYPINSWMVKKQIKHGMMTKGHHHHFMQQKISNTLTWGWVIGSYIFLFAVFYICSFFVPIQF